MGTAMNAVEKALWFIESHFRAEISLEDVADVARVTPHYLTRAFAAATGRPVMRQVRARRLSEAARALVNGAPDIVMVALDAGYGSHEAFTRAFRDHFGETPEKIRSRRILDGLHLTESIAMSESMFTALDPPRYEIGRDFLAAGLGERYTWDTNLRIPDQWQRFRAYLGNIPGQVGSTTYGVCCNGDNDGAFDYVCAVEVSDFSRVPAELTRVSIRVQRYVVFSHRDHVSTLRRTINTIWSRWLPATGLEVLDAPNFELYSPRFDERSGHGIVEIWLPIGT